MKLFSYYYLFYFILGTTSSLKIFVGIPGSIRSLSNLMSKFATVFADAGHEVVLMTSHPPEKHHENITVLDLPQLKDQWKNLNVFYMNDMTNLTNFFDNLMANSVPKVWSDPRVIELWKNRNSFDTFVCISTGVEFLFPFLMDFGGQFVQVVTPGIESVALSRSGNWLTPAVVPAILLNYDDNMTFFERVINVIGVYQYWSFQHGYAKKMFQETQKLVPSFTEPFQYYARVELTLINGHFALDGAVPLLANQVEVGTININKPKPLPQELEAFIESSGDAGVIYFTLGSIAKSSQIPSKDKLAFIEAFKRVPQKVLWKYDGDDLNLPPNVMTAKWMPQQDILNHKKTRVFISHCGNQGTQEAKYFGVPVLAVPIAFDQPRNAMRMERKKQAIVIPWNDITPENILEALDQLVNTTVYRDSIQQVSRMLKDQKESPAERAVWWVEYIARHKGAPQLVYAGKNLHLLQYIMLDVILFYVTILSVLLYVSIKGIVVLCKRKTKKLQKKKRA